MREAHARRAQRRVEERGLLPPLLRAAPLARAARRVVAVEQREELGPQLAAEHGRAQRAEERPRGDVDGLPHLRLRLQVERVVDAGHEPVERVDLPQPLGGRGDGRELVGGRLDVLLQPRLVRRHEVGRRLEHREHRLRRRRRGRGRRVRAEVPADRGEALAHDALHVRGAVRDDRRGLGARRAQELRQLLRRRRGRLRLDERDFLVEELDEGVHRARGQKSIEEREATFKIRASKPLKEKFAVKKRLDAGGRARHVGRPLGRGDA